VSLAPLPSIPVICGPTASGKSAIAMWLSRRREIVIVSADSRQIYRGFDLGTAKPSRDDQDRVPHRAIDVVDPSGRYSAAQWTELADRSIREAIASGRLPIVVGGTGFYIGALFRPLWAEPLLEPQRRAAVQQALGAKDTDELRRWCRSLDPRRAHLGRAQLLRAIEIALLTGERLSSLHATQSRPARWMAGYLLVDPGTDLPSRIAARAAAMLEGGWADEVRRLTDAVPAEAPAWNATGYDVVRQYVRGEIDRDTALERIIIETRQYAKRQRTWFRHQLEQERVERLAPNAPGWQEKVDRWIAQFTGVVGKGGGEATMDSLEGAR